MASELKRLRGVILGRLTRIEVFIRDIDSKSGLTEDHIQARLEIIDQCWAEYSTVQNNIDSSEDIDAEEEEEKRAAFEERCINARVALRSVLRKMQGQGASFACRNIEQPLLPVQLQNQLPIPQQSIAVQLPTLELPSFSGDYTNWPSFRDAFEALIDRNTQLSNVQKLLYLKSSLKENAACVLDAMDITDANYRIAWDLLKEQFENRRATKQKQLRELFNMRQITGESPKELRRLLTECQRNVNLLKQMGEPTDQWNTVLVYLFASKLDESSRRDWENQTQENETPTFEEIVTFVNKRCHTLEALEAEKGRPSKSVHYTQQSFAATISTGCRICQSSRHHPLWKCNKFITMSPAARKREVRKMKLCFNCLSSKHQAVGCHSGGCKLCGEKHNTLLHRPSARVDRAVTGNCHPT